MKDYPTLHLESNLSKGTTIVIPILHFTTTVRSHHIP